MNLKKITIVTVCFNAEDTIKETIESVISQKSATFEYIIIDGNSTDKTKSIIEEYKKKYNINYISEDDNGIYDAMNKGIDIATGEYIFFLNSGDVFYDKLVLKDLEFKLTEDNSIDVLYGNIAIKDGNKKKICMYSDFKVNPISFCRELMICHQCIFIKREALKKNKFDTKYLICADRKQLIELMKNKYKFQYIDRTISVYDNNGFSENNKDKMRNEAKKIMYEEFGVYARVIFLLRKITSIKYKFKK